MQLMADDFFMTTSQGRYAAVYRRGGPLGWQLVTLHMGAAPPQ